MLGTSDLATALGAYRMSLALTLGRQAGPFAAAADPVLAGFPPLLGDHHLLAEFLTRWRDISTKMTALLDVRDRGEGGGGARWGVRGPRPGVRGPSMWPLAEGRMWPCLFMYCGSGAGLQQPCKLHGPALLSPTPLCRAVAPPPAPPADGLLRPRRDAAAAGAGGGVPPLRHRAGAAGALPHHSLPPHQQLRGVPGGAGAAARAQASS